MAGARAAQAREAYAHAVGLHMVHAVQGQGQEQGLGLGESQLPPPPPFLPESFAASYVPCSPIMEVRVCN